MDKITLVQYTGYFSKHIYVSEIHNKKEEIRIEKILEEEREKISPIIKSEGKTIDILV